MRFMPKLGVMHVMTSSSERAHYRWGIGMCEIEHVSQGILDESTARRVEEERVAGCQEHDGTVLHLIPKDIDVFDEEVLAYWMTDEATRGIVARAAVVPSRSHSVETQDPLDVLLSRRRLSSVPKQTSCQKLVVRLLARTSRACWLFGNHGISSLTRPRPGPIERFVPANADPLVG